MNSFTFMDFPILSPRLYTFLVFSLFSPVSVVVPPSAVSLPPTSFSSSSSLSSSSSFSPLVKSHVLTTESEKPPTTFSTSGDMLAQINLPSACVNVKKQQEGKLSDVTFTLFEKSSKALNPSS